MAHNAKNKATVIHAVTVGGMSYEDAQAKYKVPKATISRWVNNAETEQKVEQKRNRQNPNGTRLATPAQKQKAEFDQKLVKLLGSSLDMLEAWAGQCQDPEFIRKNPEGVNELGRTVLERCDRILELVRNIGSGPTG
jgi:hypothetical protein